MAASWRDSKEKLLLLESHIGQLAQLQARFDADTQSLREEIWSQSLNFIADLAHRELLAAEASELKLN